MANLYSCKDIFTVRHLLCGKNQKPAQSDHIFLMVVLWRCFKRLSSVLDDHFWVVPRVFVLYRFDCNASFYKKYEVPIKYLQWWVNTHCSIETEYSKSNVAFSLQEILLKRQSKQYESVKSESRILLRK